jgi:hypothetical protein
MTATRVLVVALVIGFFVWRHVGNNAVERVAEVEHDQWMAWSKSVAAEVSEERRVRWEKLWVPYKDLPEAEKEKDRAWARKAIKAAEGSE